MHSGSMRITVIVQSPTGSRDSVGERTTSWTNVATVRARVEPLRANELIAAGQANMSVTHKVTLRYDSAISSMSVGWRLTYGSRYFIIDGVRNIGERNRTYELLCTEGLREE